MTFGEIQEQVRIRLDDTSTTFYSDDDVKEAINDAYRDLADSAEWYERYADWTASAGRSYYDLTEVLPDVLLTPKQLFNPTANLWLEPDTARSMDSQGMRQWELHHGQPRRVLTFGSWFLAVYPKPDTDMALRLLYTAIPLDLDDDDEEPAFDVEFQEGLIWGALYYLYADQRETQKALRFFAKYSGVELAFTRWVSGRQSQDRRSGLKG